LLKENLLVLHEFLKISTFLKENPLKMPEFLKNEYFFIEKFLKLQQNAFSTRQNAISSGKMIFLVLKPEIESRIAKKKLSFQNVMCSKVFKKKITTQFKTDFFSTLNVLSYIKINK
jgi:hypothetical protein